MKVLKSSTVYVANGLIELWFLFRRSRCTLQQVGRLLTSFALFPIFVTCCRYWTLQSASCRLPVDHPSCILGSTCGVYCACLKRIVFEVQRCVEFDFVCNCGVKFVTLGKQKERTPNNDCFTLATIELCSTEFTSVLCCLTLHVHRCST